MENRLIRGRYAPSPSGNMHLGNAWAALLAWLQVRQAGGSFVLRIEDLDPQRSRPEYCQSILEDLRWLGLDWDEGPNCGGIYGPYRQSQRASFYKEALNHLKEQQLVYPCFCSRADILSASAPHENKAQREYSGTCRCLSPKEIDMRKLHKPNYSLRFRTPDTYLSFEDLIYGKQKLNPFQELGDFIIYRSDQIPAYQLAVVVDDAEMKITHVLRGADLLTSTARQLLLYSSLKYSFPQFTHVPLLYGPDGERLSKRHGSISLRSFCARGVQPEQIIGQLAYWAGLLETPTPIKPAELIPLFDLKKVPIDPIQVNIETLF